MRGSTSLVLLAALVASAASAAPLLLSPLIAKGDISGAINQSQVTVNGKFMGYSAFITVPSPSGKNTNNIYFWYQPCRNPGCASKPVADVPFVIWLQGGPGAPGTFGAFSEIGNYYLDENLNVQDRCFSWCDNANCLFVDQPVQTGFSYQLNASGQFDPDNIEYTSSSADAMQQVWQVLKQLNQIWPQVSQSPFYITGESYGGLYTAHLGYTIYQHNQDPKESFKIALTGLAVGDPIINSGYQWLTYANTLYGMGVIMYEEMKNLEAIFLKGVMHLEDDCWTAFSYWNSVWNDNGGGGAPGLFFEYTGSAMTENVLIGDTPAAFNYDVPFFQNQAVAFHIDGSPSHGFEEGGEVYNTMVRSGDFCSNSSWIYATLFLEAQIDVMIYSSTADPLLGPPTTEAGVSAMWDYATENIPGGEGAAEKFWNSKKTIWHVNSKTDTQPAGYARCSNQNNKRFCYTVVRNAGHTTPSFAPRASYDLFRRFVQRAPFDASGESTAIPQCAECGGVEPFAGDSLPACVCGKQF